MKFIYRKNRPNVYVVYCKLRPKIIVKAKELGMRAKLTVFGISIAISMLLTTYHTVYGQNVGTGALIDESKYSDVPLATPLTIDSYDKLPPRYSLKNFCPTPGDQGTSGTCVGWSVAYGARTIVEAAYRSMGNTEQQPERDSMAFSPSFVYNQILADEGIDDCNLGGYISDALELLRDTGTLTIKEFPFTPNCSDLPTHNQIRAAKLYKIKGFQRLTFHNNDELKVKKVKESLAANMPVIVGIKIFDNLKRVKQENYIWNPAEGDPTTALTHAMLVVGYDDNAGVFELMNSWGSHWCNNGFVYIRYSDFAKQMREAYHILYDMPDIKGGHTQPNLAATLSFKHLSKDKVISGENCNGQTLGTMSARLDGMTYKMLNRYEAYTSYQIQLTTGVKNMAVYVFSFDRSGNTDLLYPFQPNIVSLYNAEAKNVTITPIIPFEGATVAIPHEDYCMQLDEQIGTVNCFLFSRSELNIDLLLKKIEQTSGTFQERLAICLKEKIAQPDDIDFSPLGIGFEANVADFVVVPIVVDMNHY